MHSAGGALSAARGERREARRPRGSLRVATRLHLGGHHRHRGRVGGCQAGKLAFQIPKNLCSSSPHASGLTTDALRNLNIVLKGEFEMPLGRYRGRVWNQVGAGASETRGACER